MANRRMDEDGMNRAQGRHRRWTSPVLGVVLAGLAAGGLATQVRADSAAFRFQAVLLKKVLQYDHTLDGKKLSILVVDPKADDVVKALSEVGLKATGFTELPANLEKLDFSVLLLAEASPVAKALCARKKILSASFNPELVTSGEVSFGLRKREVGPLEILVNLKRMREESHALSADLLAMVTVIR